jgi:hypothetical protein
MLVAGRLILSAISIADLRMSISYDAFSKAMDK